MAAFGEAGRLTGRPAGSPQRTLQTPAGKRRQQAQGKADKVVRIARAIYRKQVEAPKDRNPPSSQPPPHFFFSPLTYHSVKSTLTLYFCLFGRSVNLRSSQSSPIFPGGHDPARAALPGRPGQMKVLFSVLSKEGFHVKRKM